MSSSHVHNQDWNLACSVAFAWCQLSIIGSSNSFICCFKITSMIFFLLCGIHFEVAAGQPFNLLFNKINTFFCKSVLHLFFNSSQSHGFSLNSLKFSAYSLICRPHTRYTAPKRAELVLNQRRGNFILCTFGVITWEPSAEVVTHTARKVVWI